MPNYDFQCLNCSKLFERTIKISELDGRHVCPACGSIRVVQKILLAPARAESHRLGYNMKKKEFREVLGNIHRRTAGSVLDKTTDIR